MSKEKYQRTKRLLEAALELSEDERHAYLDAACAGDEELRAEVENLLGYAETPSDFLEAPDRSQLVAQRSASPKTVGNYRILRTLGEGGMGTVFEAEQDAPRRRVALKVLRPGIGSLLGIRRFEFETEILGRLSHPGIARIYDAGTEDWGAGPQPYLVMELIEGLPLSAYVERHASDVRARMQLVATIADAVDHAHRKGIVHRDLKPDNILVDASGQPRVVDFGIARATDPDVRTTHELTGEGQILGTLAYMSPEQAGGDPADIDTRTDVYAIGAIAYELVTGALPLDVKGKTLLEAARVVREDVVRDPRRLDRSVSDDLAAILLKCLEKEPDRRYRAASELADDLRAWLEFRPIVARHTTSFTKLRLSIRRRPLRATLVALLCIAFLGATTLATYVVATAPERAAGTQKLRLDRAARALRDGFLAMQSFDMVRAQRRFDEGLEDAPLSGDLRVELIVGRAMATEDRRPSLQWLDRVHKTGTPPRALDRLRAFLLELAGEKTAAKDLTERLGDATDATDMLVAGWILRERVPRTTESLRAALRLFQSAQYHSRVPSFLTLTALTDTALDIGEFDLAQDAADALYRLWPDSPNGATAVAAVLARKKEYSKAIEILRAAREKAPDSLFVDIRLAAVLGESGRFKEAIAIANGVRARNPQLIRSYMILIPALAMTGDFEGSLEACRAALELPGRREEIHVNYGNVLAMQRDLEGAAEQFEKALELHPGHAIAHANLLRSLGRLGAPEGVLAELQRWAELRPEDAKAWAELARFHLDAESIGAVTDPAEALRFARKAVDVSSSNDPFALWILARAFDAVEKPDSAREAVRQAAAVADTQPKTSRDLRRQIRRLARRLAPEAPGK